MNATEITEALHGNHVANGHIISAASELLSGQQKEISRLIAENQDLRQEMEYWKYQLEIHGVQIKDMKP